MIDLMFYPFIVPTTAVLETPDVIEVPGVGLRAWDSELLLKFPSRCFDDTRFGVFCLTFDSQGVTTAGIGPY